MTYNAFSGTLNPTHLLTYLLTVDSAWQWVKHGQVFDGACVASGSYSFSKRQEIASQDQRRSDVEDLCER